MEPALISLSALIGQVGLVGTASLIALHLADRNVAEDELRAVVHVESVSTLRNALRTCEIHEYASSIKRAARGLTFWHITDIGKAIVSRVISLLGLPGASTTADSRLIAPPAAAAADFREKKFFSGASSSSSDLDQSSGSDQIQIEEEEDGREFKKFLCREFGLTGAPARQLIDDPRIWSDDVVAWILTVRQMARDKFRFRKSPEAYALGCLLKAGGPEQPSKEFEYQAKPVIDRYWQQFQQAKQIRGDNDDRP
jgi:hypothetical protein